MFSSWFLKPVLSSSIFLLLISVCSSSKKYVWSPTNEWSPCSTQCDQGEEHNIFECVQSTPYGTTESVLPEKCNIDRKPTNKRKCFMGPCPTSAVGSFVWVTGNWTLCPSTCGGLALQNREVSCYHKTQSGNMLLSKLSKCDSKIEPDRFLSCARTDCPPKFLASKWGKCPISQNCGKSVRRRNVQCVSMLKDGNHKIISSSFCYRMHRKPLSSWTFCTSEKDKQCKNITDLNRLRASNQKIERDEAEIFQMRIVKRLKLSVGQTAYVFTYTKLAIECPIDGFPVIHLQWSHNGSVFMYQGGSSDRVRVNRRGMLIIQEFLLEDIGIWRCTAGKSSAEIHLKHELPSNGFQNWLKRHSNHNFGMFNEEAKGAFIRPESLVWVKSDWSLCSLSCGTEDEVEGHQERKVSCEKIEAKYYKVVDDKYCTAPKPESKRRCKPTKSCPVWRVEKETNERCTDQCIDKGVAKMNTNIYCEYESRSVDPSFCESVLKPNITCQNPRCKILYRYGPWSRCSLSCSNTTSTSIRSRTMQCVWHHNQQSAFNLCQHYNLSHRPLIKSCRVPKCVLGCHDLSSACKNQSKYRCRSSLFHHFCCAFCRQQNF